MKGAIHAVEGGAEAVLQEAAPKAKRGAQNGRMWCYPPHRPIGLINEVAIQLTREHVMLKIKIMQNGEN